MLKHTQTIYRQFANELFECVCPFCGDGASRINIDDLPISDKCFFLTRL